MPCLQLRSWSLTVVMTDGSSSKLNNIDLFWIVCSNWPKKSRSASSLFRLTIFTVGSSGTLMTNLVVKVRQPGLVHKLVLRTSYFTMTWLSRGSKWMQSLIRISSWSFVSLTCLPRSTLSEKWSLIKRLRWCLQAFLMSWEHLSMPSRTAWASCDLLYSSTRISKSLSNMTLGQRWCSRTFVRLQLPSCFLWLTIHSTMLSFKLESSAWIKKRSELETL